MKLSIGTPPLELTVLVDTGSDLIWTQCLPCTKCYNQDRPIFDSSNSSTYDDYSCFSDACKDVIGNECTYDDMCMYKIRYGDNTTSKGILSSDTFTLTSTDGLTISIPGMIFGCGNENSGIFSEAEQGTVGLSGGSLSLISQLGLHLHMGRKFSHCFMPRWSKQSGDSNLYIGESAILFGNSTKLTLSKSEGGDILYYLSLEDISVGSERLNVPLGTFDLKSDGSGGVFIDSGTPLTYLNSVAFDMLVKKLREVIKLQPIGSEDDTAALCYDGNTGDLEEPNVPFMTFHFSNLDVTIHPKNSFIEISREVVCLALMPTNRFSIIGNYFQQNMNVGFDLDKQELTMGAATCATF